MKKYGIFILGLFLVLVTAGYSHAVLVTLQNPGFESGDLTGWAYPASGAVAVKSYGSYVAREGQFFLLLTAAPGQTINVTQTVDVTAGQSLSGWGALISDGSDKAWTLSILDGYGEPLFSRSNMSTLGWVAWEPWIAEAGGTFTVQLSLRNNNSAGSSTSYALFDLPVPITTPNVPIPTTALLLASGLVGLIAIRRRRSR